MTTMRTECLTSDRRAAAADNLRTLTAVFDLSRQELAYQCHVSESHISRVANGKRLASWTLAQTINDLLQEHKSRRDKGREQKRQKFLCGRQRHVKMRFETSAGPGVTLDKETRTQIRKVIWRSLSITVFGDTRPPLELPEKIHAVLAEIVAGNKRYHIIETRTFSESDEALLQAHEIGHVIESLTSLQAAVLAKVSMRPHEFAESEY